MPDIPYGFCHCGCGEKTNLQKFSAATEGRVKGQPSKYLLGHGSYKKTPEYLEEDRGYETPCWVWQRTLFVQGYGKKIVEGRSLRAHGVYYERAKGPVPEGLQLDHLCRVKSCVNPNHLEAVTQEVNIQRGRCAKLTPDDVREILSVSRRISNRKLGECYGVDETTISLIRRGKTWRNIPRSA